MIRRARFLAVGVLLAASLLAAPTIVLARTHQSPPVAKLMDLHFEDAKGGLHTLTVQVVLPALEAIQDPCPNFDAEMARATAAVHKPELSVMTFVGASCHGQSFTRPASVAPQPLDTRPAVVVLFYRDSGGSNHYSVFGDESPGDYQMGDCAVVLLKTRSALIKQAQPNHLGQKFLDASCLPRSDSVLRHFQNN